MGVEEIGGVGSRLLGALMVIGVVMAMNPYVGFAILPIAVLAIAIPQIPQLQFGERFNPFAGFLESRFGRAGRYVRERYGHHYGGIAKAGSFGPVEAFTFIAYVVASLACFGLIALPDVTYKTLALVVLVISSIILLAQKAHLKFTALEMICFVISVLLPVMASGVFNGFTLPADWTADTWHKVGLWTVSAVATVVMAYQD